MYSFLGFTVRFVAPAMIYGTCYLLFLDIYAKHKEVMDENFVRDTVKSELKEIMDPKFRELQEKLENNTKNIETMTAKLDKLENKNNT
jgi:hypothetical protein